MTMKVDRPVGGPAAVPEASETGRARGAEEKGGASFAEKLHGTDPAGPPAPVAPAEIEALVGRLRAGEITMEGLLETLVQNAVAAAPLGPAGQEELRAMLRAVLEGDPTLQRLTRAIEQG